MNNPQYSEKPSNGAIIGQTLASAAASSQQPPLPAYHTKFACMSFHMTDRIRLIRFNDDERNVVRTIIQHNWPKGMQYSRPYGQAQEFKLSGRPWSSKPDRPYARRLVCRLLEGLFDQGWILKAPVDISKKEFDADSLIFHYRQPPPPACQWLSISFDQGDCLTLIDAPLPFIHTLTDSATLGPMIQRSQRHSNYMHEIKFRGYPWRASGEETVQARVLVLELLDCLEVHGYSLYASIDQDRGGGDNHRSEADAWYCCRAVGWEPGMVVYQS